MIGGDLTVLLPPMNRRSQRLWEQSLLAMASGQPTSMLMTQHFREQARSHRGFVMNARPENTSKKNVGASLLAMAVDQLASALDVPPSSRASSLPQLD
ncbi:hypothetical protein C1C98_02865 [Pseudomonas ogarae]|uniref:Uncharacterized protein n=1 Tax=Pseudomonas ogarae (strain DSM 112162 / CECT 30235 / F113) TaxID=1114970 RepID=A0ABM6QTF8_PSEO1|nr:hypothetical protein C1C98_02865 [Pseudomonas ogarae]